ncbi:hypothetical protein GCM10011490_27580 [Pseudoclavibacter endophyticus]|uniref:Winged helix DNA-binding protein n=1 Tax=Pseudoclavibacter endophyticus TaxID=1778590 RepID=A0A6H9WNI2_9MICO|nr:MarR family transcriptional regulator [Pseudoclavibacter endophyticus]KAB1646815.1 winged helix DNA-binding protein [Pseudoclavibacter endophyticus]GGA75301.1 hypothetical protein GCM10011490_27580 [Pseudoclavibacter endophyticus]
MPREPKAELVERFTRETRELTRLLARTRLKPVLELELSLQQLKIVLLVATGEATSGRALADHLHVSPATISVSIERLVEMGYLVRDEVSADRRVKRLTVTPKSADLYDQFLNKREAPDEILTSLALDDLEALVQGVYALRRAVAQREDGNEPDTQ